MDAALVAGIPENQIIHMKQEFVTERIKDSMAQNGTSPRRYIDIMIGAKQIELNKIKDEYKQLPKLYGFKSVKAFYQTYKQTKADLERLQKEAQDQGNGKSDFTGEELPTAKDTGKKKSIHDRLAENKKAMEDKQSFSKSPKVKKSRAEEL